MEIIELESLDCLDDGLFGIATAPSARPDDPAFQRIELDMLSTLMRAAAARDDDTLIHMIRIGVLAERLAIRSGESADFALDLRRAAPLHDIGKIAIPDSILKKRAPLSTAEWSVMHQHCGIGAGMLGRSAHPLFRLAAVIALNHHERVDGSGYPSRLSGEQIPLAARIVSVVDVFDALTMDRSFRPAHGDAHAFAMLIEQGGQGLDARLVDCLLVHADEFIELRDTLTMQPPDLWDALGLDQFTA